MNNILANYPALLVLNPECVANPNFELDNDKGYCRISSQQITLRCFPKDKYEYIRNFYFGEADGEYFCNPVAAMITDSKKDQKITIGYNLGDVLSIDGKNFKLEAAPNSNIKLVSVD